MRFFTFAELCKSNTAEKHRIINVPTTQERENLIALVENVLDPLREALGKPVIVTSGFRSIALNRLTGGAPSSQHSQGKAADIICPPFTTLEICETVFRNKIPFDQIINEFGRWVHISFNAGANRGQYLEAIKLNGITRYIPRTPTI